MKVIVVRQPWAWLIVHGYKDIENRSWKTRYRGTLLIQASANLPPKWAARRRSFVRSTSAGLSCPKDFEKGGIVGMVQLEDCVTTEPKQMVRGTGRMGSLEAKETTAYSTEGSARSV